MQLFPRWEPREGSPLNSETEHSRDDCVWMNTQERDCPNLQLAILPAHRVCGLEPDRRCCGHMKCLAARSSTTGRRAAARAVRPCSDDAGCAPLSPRQAPGATEAAGVHRSCEGPKLMSDKGPDMAAMRLRLCEFLNFFVETARARASRLSRDRCSIAPPSSRDRAPQAGLGHPVTISWRAVHGPGKPVMRTARWRAGAVCPAPYAGWAALPAEARRGPAQPGCAGSSTIRFGPSDAPARSMPGLLRSLLAAHPAPGPGAAIWPRRYPAWARLPQRLPSTHSCR
jgi:hypothetical protein